MRENPEREAYCESVYMWVSIIIFGPVVLEIFLIILWFCGINLNVNVIIMIIPAVYAGYFLAAPLIGMAYYPYLHPWLQVLKDGE